MDNTVFERARCIWTNDDITVNVYGSFQHFFLLTRPIVRPFLKISADSGYMVWLNGHLIESQQYADYPFYKVYDEIELLPAWFSDGENKLSILGYCQNEDSSTYRKGHAGIIFEITDGETLLCESSEATVCSEITGFTCGDIEKISGQLSFSFRYDANIGDSWICQDNRGNPGWYQSKIMPKAQTYYPRPIDRLFVSDPVPCRILAQGLFNNPIGQAINGKRMEGAWMKHVPFGKIACGSRNLPSNDGISFMTDETCDGIYILIDMLKEQSGYVLLNFEVEEPCTIDVGYGEHLEDLRVRSAVGDRNFAFTYYAKKGRNQFTYQFKRIGVRYFQLHVGNKQIKLIYAGVKSADYPVKERNMPSGLDGLERKIYEISIDTLKRCMHEHYEDCPWREQALYGMDSRNQMLFGYDAFGEYAFPKASLRLLALGMREDGLLELCAPAVIGCNIPSFSLIWVVALEEYYRYSKDISFVSEMIPTVEKILGTFRKNVKDNLLYNLPCYWGFYEWSPYMDGINETRDQQVTRDGADAPLNAFFAMALRSAEILFSALEQTTLAQDITEEINQLKRAYRKAFFSESKKAYRVSTTVECLDIFPELVQALTICANLCDSEKEQNELIERLVTNDFWPETTLSHLIFKYDAMLKKPSLYKEVLKDVDSKWGEMLFKGSTTFWETGLGAEDFNDAGSLCHGWSAVPIYVYHRIFNNKEF